MLQARTFKLLTSNTTCEQKIFPQSWQVYQAEVAIMLNTTYQLLHALLMHPVGSQGDIDNPIRRSHLMLWPCRAQAPLSLIPFSDRSSTLSLVLWAERFWGYFWEYTSAPLHLISLPLKLSTSRLLFVVYASAKCSVSWGNNSPPVAVGTHAAPNEKRNISNSRAAIWYVEHLHTLYIVFEWCATKNWTPIIMNKIEIFTFGFPPCFKVHTTYFSILSFLPHNLAFFHYAEKQ